MHAPREDAGTLRPPPSHRRHPAHRAASEGAVHQRRRQGGGEPSRTSGAHENRRRGRNRGGGHGGVLAEASDVRRDRDDSKAAGADRAGVARGVQEVQRQRSPAEQQTPANSSSSHLLQRRRAEVASLVVLGIEEMHEHQLQEEIEQLRDQQAALEEIEEREPISININFVDTKEEE